MNRRSLLKFSGQAAIGMMAAPPVFGTPRLDARLPVADWSQIAESEHVATIHRMINESGSMWLQVRERANGKNPIIVYFGTYPAFELTCNSQDRWQVRYREITATELAEFNTYISELVSHGLDMRIGGHYPDRDWRIRSWIKNGRNPEWNTSIERANT